MPEMIPESSVNKEIVPLQEPETHQEQAAPETLVKTQRLSEETMKLITKLTVIGAFAVVMAGICVLGYLGVERYQAAQVEKQVLKKEAAHKNAQAAIRKLTDFCGFAHVSDEEQLSVDKCGDDVDAARFALGKIIDNRICYWQTVIGNCDTKIDKLMSIKRSSTYWAPSTEQLYRQAGAKIVKDYQEAKREKDEWVQKQEKLKDPNLLTQ
jgi:heme/copper-type cytochrome/quinol oxidase subunit 1